MWQIVMMGILLFVCMVLTLTLVINGCILAVKSIRHSDKRKAGQRTKMTAIVLSCALFVGALLVGITQRTASTPAIRDASGNVMDGSIAELLQVELNGRKEWISIRGQSVEKPLLLFLAGGPGGSQMAAVRHDLAELEEHFVVVNWDQPGSGKSYGVIARKELTTDDYVKDGYALTKYLCDRFGQEKIYLLGESWGSALGIFMAAQHPEAYHAFIGTGQMVDFVETEIIDYNLAMELARQAGDDSLVSTLEGNGPPPYEGKDVTWKSAAYLNYLSGIMARNPDIRNGGFNTWRDLGSSEYGLLDKVNYMLGIVNTFNHVYPQLYSVDLRDTYHSLQIPVYFFLGRHDINAPIALAEEYFELLDAPHKEIVWFEHSGHNPWINESDKFVDEVVRVTAE